MTQHFNQADQRAKRKALRHNATEAEERLWQYLKGKNLGSKFRRQYSVDAYILDFYSPGSKLAIEVDGGSHFTPAAREYDQERTSYLNLFGIEVLRFTNLEVFENMEGVLETIAEAVKRRLTSP